MESLGNARIIDETGRPALWTETLREVLSAAGFGITDSDSEEAALTVLLYPEDSGCGETEYGGDLLLLEVPDDDSQSLDKSLRTEVIGSHRLKARHHLTGIYIPNSLAEELRPLVNLFLV